MKNTLDPGTSQLPAKFSSQGDRERPCGEEREMQPCEARILAWYGCAAPENTSVVMSTASADKMTALKLLVT